MTISKPSSSIFESMTEPSIHDRMFRSAEAPFFSETAQLSAMLRVEAALAQAEAELGLIPASAAKIVTEAARLENLDRDALGMEAALAGNIAIPLVKQLTATVRRQNEQAAGFVHWGATSQDILDTALVLQLKQHLAAVNDLLRKICESLAVLADKHRGTIMPGRTWLQQAVPVTFGLKAAGWLDAFLRDLVRLQEIGPRVLVLQFGGAAGTLASLGDRGTEVSVGLAHRLGLNLPPIPWHTHRDRIGEIACFHGLIAGTLGKLARDLSLCMQTEVAELSEPTAPGRGGSSTMPHKQNPIASSFLLAASLRVPGMVSTILAAMLQEHERGLGGWQAEWETLPELCNLTLGALRRAAETIPQLVVHGERMTSNLKQSRGLDMAEAVSMHLAKQIGRDRAHALVEEASRLCVQQSISFSQALLQDPESASYLSVNEIDYLLDPSNYLGNNDGFIDNVLGSFRDIVAH